MKSTRQRIVEYLESKKIGTVPTLSRALSLTPANIRHHLNILLKEGAVEITGQRPIEGRGRPTQIFALTRQSQRHNLDGLANALLSELLEDSTSPAYKMRFKKIAARIANFPEGSKGALSQRLVSTVWRLNELGYNARWEAHAGSPHIILGHCPYAPIIQDHPEVCQLDQALIEHLTNQSAEQVEKLNQDAAGAVFCRFLLNRTREYH